MSKKTPTDDKKPRPTDKIKKVAAATGASPPQTGGGMKGDPSRRDGLPTDCPIYCIGSDQKTRQYLFGVGIFGEIFDINIYKINRKSLDYLFRRNPEWKRKLAPERDKDGNIIEADHAYNEKVLSNLLIKGCAKNAPNFDENVIRHDGFWKEYEDGEKHWIAAHNGRIWKNGQMLQNLPKNRWQGTRYYTTTPLEMDGEVCMPQATMEWKQVQATYEELFSSWSWAEPHAVTKSLFIGWSVMAIISGFLKQSPHLWVNGEAGGGKTKLLETYYAIFGDWLHPPSNSLTPAVLRRIAAGTSRVMLSDEAEFQQRSRDAVDSFKALMMVYRHLFDHGKAQVASLDPNKGNKAINYYPLCGSALLASIHYVSEHLMPGGNSSRNIRITLKSRKDEETPAHNPDLENRAQLRALGQNIIHRLLRNTAHLEDRLEGWKSFLKNSPKVENGDDRLCYCLAFVLTGLEFIAPKALPFEGEIREYEYVDTEGNERMPGKVVKANLDEIMRSQESGVGAGGEIERFLNHFFNCPINTQSTGSGQMRKGSLKRVIVEMVQVALRTGDSKGRMLVSDSFMGEKETRPTWTDARKALSDMGICLFSQKNVESGSTKFLSSEEDVRDTGLENILIGIATKNENVEALFPPGGNWQDLVKDAPGVKTIKRGKTKNGKQRKNTDFLCLPLPPEILDAVRSKTDTNEDD